jgi:hypothetical protein
MYAESAETNVTSVVLMSACNHMGFVDEGMHFFVCIASGYRIPATVDHYALAWLVLLAQAILAVSIRQMI